MSEINVVELENLERDPIFRDIRCYFCEYCGIYRLKKTLITSHINSCHKKSNLQKHVKAVHYKEKPFVCGFPDCGMRFAYKHARDKHERTGLHVYTHGNFEESDEGHGEGEGERESVLQLKC